MERRNTKQRKMVLEAVQSRHDHPTAEQIYEQVKSIDSKISLGTVYRNLSVLAEDGFIQIIKMPDADRFDLVTEAHQHFICNNCGKIFDIHLEYDKSIDKLPMPKGFKVISHQTVFKGLCADCAKSIK
ncbi:MAG: transcriptional repressor [Bacillota bacterium]|nr:transcriptional repressor [Bacillota bacterium]